MWDKHVLPCLGGYQLRELTPAIVAHWRTDRHDSGAGDSVLRWGMVVLQGMLKYAVPKGKTSTNVVRVVDKPRQEQPDWPEPVPPLIVEKIRATRQPRDASSSRSWPTPACGPRRRSPSAGSTGTAASSASTRRRPAEQG